MRKIDVKEMEAALKRLGLWERFRTEMIRRGRTEADIPPGKIPFCLDDGEFFSWETSLLGPDFWRRASMEYRNALGVILARRALREEYPERGARHA